jgi:hypothetical protein
METMDTSGLTHRIFLALPLFLYASKPRESQNARNVEIHLCHFKRVDLNNNRRLNVFLRNRQNQDKKSQGDPPGFTPGEPSWPLFREYVDVRTAYSVCNFVLPAFIFRDFLNGIRHLLSTKSAFPSSLLVL